ncbi:hypothetical protein C8R43DRAFT_261712 [Mycena crocata]|nr:hypothetical protein C8R43DRAFT_261712 [Mycena crocata]
MLNLMVSIQSSPSPPTGNPRLPPHRSRTTPPFVTEGCTDPYPGVTAGVRLSVYNSSKPAEANHITLVGGSDATVGFTDRFLQGDGNGVLPRPRARRRPRAAIQSRHPRRAVPQRERVPERGPVPRAVRRRRRHLWRRPRIHWVDVGWGGYAMPELALFVTQRLSKEEAAASTEPLLVVPLTGEAFPTFSNTCCACRCSHPSSARSVRSPGKHRNRSKGVGPILQDMAGRCVSERRAWYKIGIALRMNTALLPATIMTARKAYTGARTLVFGIDVGTTFSGVSYSILEPGQVPVIRSITRFPGQQDVGGDSKVPTAILYGPDGIIRALGAETSLAEYVEQAQNGGWELAEWFKLHLRPTDDQPDIPPLPHRGQTPTSVFADFLKYLFNCAKTFIEETHPDGRALLLSLQNNVQFVLAHPNGWEGKEQFLMREAVVMAGLIPESEAHDRLRFVTEGEASLHFCIENGLGTDTIAQGRGIVVVDAGGGTVDLSTYRLVKKPNGNHYEEIAPPECLFQGSIYVTSRAQGYLQEHLGNSKYAGDIDSIADIFDTSAKLSFRGEFCYIKFGTSRDNEPSLNISRGQLKIPGSVVKQFFEPSISAIVDAVIDQYMSAARAHFKVSSVFLVGGFAANDWLFSELKLRLDSNQLNLNLVRPDAHVNKAVADGAVSFYIDHHVSARVAKFTYGVRCSEPYNPMDVEHTNRLRTRYRGFNGDLFIPNCFSAILPRGVQVCETQEFKQDYFMRNEDCAALDHFSLDLFIYLGSDNPRWMDIDDELFKPICTIEADTSRLIKHPTYRRIGGRPASVFYELKFNVILSFGLTELKAQIAWSENGVEKRGPVDISY